MLQKSELQIIFMHQFIENQQKMNIFSNINNYDKDPFMFMMFLFSEMMFALPGHCVCLMHNLLFSS